VAFAKRTESVPKALTLMFNRVTFSLLHCMSNDLFDVQDPTVRSFNVRRF